MAMCIAKSCVWSKSGSAIALLAALSLGFVGVSPVHAGNTAYTYDALGRVVSVAYTDGSTVQYTYDAAGNRVAVQRTPVAPVASSASISTAYGVTGTTNLSITGTYTSTAIAVAAQHGTASVSGATASYIPGAGFYGSDSFTYTANNGSVVGPQATVTVTVAPPVPAAGAVSFGTAYNTPASGNLAITGPYGSAVISTNPGHGSAYISGGVVYYTPSSTYYGGTDTFAYTATNTTGTSSPGTISVTVAAPVAPSVGTVNISTSYNTPSANSSLSISGAYTYTSVVSQPTHGSVSLSGDSFVYTPSSGYYGSSDSFTYTATNGNAASPVGTVNIALTGIAVTENASANTPYNTSVSVPLPINGSYTSTQITSGPSHGSASISGGTLTYTPSSTFYGGSDSVSYTASNSFGTSSPSTVTISVGAPAAPTAGNDSLSTAYNTAGSVGLSPSGVYTSLALASNPAHGSASISGTTATYNPTPGYYGSDSFTYTATGPGGTSSPATVSVSVGLPAAPTISGTSINTPYNTAGSGTISVGGVYSSTAISALPAHGSASISGTTVAYSPTSGYSGSDSFSVTASGPGGTSAPATVNVTVQPNPVVTINVTSASNLRTLANNAGYGGASGVSYQFVVPSGTTVEGASSGGQAIATGTWPSGVTLSLVVSGAVYGGGGAGGYGGASTVSGVGDPGGAGSTGGDAVYVQTPISIVVNAGGAIEAGGGGGGGGAAGIYSSKVTGSGSACGGGGGFPDGAGGAAGNSGTKGGTGSTSGGGGSGASCGTGGHGGAGGAAGSAGAAGTTEGSNAGGTGGAAGYAIRFNGNSVGVSNSGTITGTQG